MERLNLDIYVYVQKPAAWSATREAFGKYPVLFPFVNEQLLQWLGTVLDKVSP